MYETIEKRRLKEFFRSCNQKIEKIPDDWYYHSINNYMSDLENLSIEDISDGIDLLPLKCMYRDDDGVFRKLFEKCLSDIRSDKLNDVIR